MNNETWKDVEGYDGIFQISSLGNVKRVKSPSGKYLMCKPLKVYKHKNGYSGISLWKTEQEQDVELIGWWLRHLLTKRMITKR